MHIKDWSQIPLLSSRKEVSSQQQTTVEDMSDETDSSRIKGKKTPTNHKKKPQTQTPTQNQKTKHFWV